MAATFSFSAGRSETARRASAKEYLAMGEEDMAAVARGLVSSAHDYLELIRRREQYRAAYRDFFRSWDIFLAPIAPIPAFPHIPGSAEESSFEIEGLNVPYGRLAVYPGVATLSGQPATTFPAGRTREGLPISLQAIGPYLEDRTPIRFAALLADEIGGYQPPPGYD
jgi:amidase